MTFTQFIGNYSTGATGGGGVSAYGPVHTSGGLFQRNTAASGHGGGLRSATNLTISGTQFISNTATVGDGGGAYSSATAQLTDGLVQNNTASSGGGIWTGTALTITGTRFISNTATSGTGGGGAYAGGAVSASAGLFERNGAYVGGGLWTGDTLMLNGTRFIENTATLDGGGAYATTPSGSSRLVNALFAANFAPAGAALTTDGAGAVDIIHTTIGNPAGAMGSAIHVIEGTTHVTNTIISGYATDVAANGIAAASVDYCLTDSAPVWSGPVTAGGHNVVGMLGFIDPANDDYHLALNSAGIDRGTDAGVTTDLDGVPRPVGPAFDIGAYETTAMRYVLPVVLRAAP